jgi:hypothetical protein
VSICKALAGLTQKAYLNGTSLWKTKSNAADGSQNSAAPSPGFEKVSICKALAGLTQKAYLNGTSLWKAKSNAADGRFFEAKY